MEMSDVPRNGSVWSSKIIVAFIPLYLALGSGIFWAGKQASQIEEIKLQRNRDVVELRDQIRRHERIDLHGGADKRLDRLEALQEGDARQFDATKSQMLHHSEENTRRLDRIEKKMDLLLTPPRRRPQ
jgi:hypothetical protein